MYLIQQVTKQPSDEIIAFFYNFSKEVFIIGCKNMSGRSIRKDIQAMYPGTSIPFKLLVKGQKTNHIWNQKKKAYVSGEGFSGTAEVTFPDNPVYMQTEAIIDMIMEQTLLGGSSIPDFEAPKSRTPKMYKDLIAEVMKHGKTIQHSGHPRETGPTDEALD